MKALCIDTSPPYCEMVLKEGEVYDVVQSLPFYDSYHVPIFDTTSSKGSKKQYHYKKSRFILTSDIDETEQIENQQIIKQYV